MQRAECSAENVGCDNLILDYFSLDKKIEQKTAYV